MRYLDELPEEPVALFEFGAEFHRAIDEYSLYCYNAMLARDHGKATMMAKRYDDPRLRRAVGGLGDNITLRRDLVYTEGDAIEQEFELELPSGDLLRGRIDLVEVDADYADGESRVELTDYKSGWPAEYPPWAQLEFYAACWNVLHPGCPNWKLQVAYPESGLPPKERFLSVNELSLDYVADWIDRINAETEWEARPSQRNCQACGYHSSCPMPGVSGWSITPERAPAIAEEYIHEKEWITSLKVGLAEYTREHGPIELPSGEVIGWHKQEGSGVTWAKRKDKQADAARRVELFNRAPDHIKAQLVNVGKEKLTDLLGDTYEEVNRAENGVEYEGKTVDGGTFTDEQDPRRELLEFVVPAEDKAVFGVRKGE